MNRNLLLGVAFFTLTPFATADPRGTVPKTSADRYPAHAEQGGTKIGAALMSPEEARKVFGFDVDRACLIVEVALYPLNDKERKVSLGDFSLRVVRANTAVKPSTATAVAANWQQLFRVQKDVKVEPSGEVAVGPHNGHACPKAKHPRQLRVTSTSPSCRGKNIPLFSWTMKQTEAGSFCNFPKTSFEPAKLERTVFGRRHQAQHADRSNPSPD